MRNLVVLPLILMFFLGTPPGYGQTASEQSFDKSLARPAALPSLRVGNDLVAVQVRALNDTSVGGEITYAGVFNIGTADDRALLFNFPQEPFSSHFNVRVDGVTYSNDPRRTAANLLTLVSFPAVIDSAIECLYAAGPIVILQRLTPQRFSRTTGAIFIEYLLTNTDAGRSHQAGVLLEMDTNIGGNDQAPVLTSFGYSRFEQKFVAPALPDFFQAFQGNLVAPNLVAQGTLLGYNAVRPDQLIIGDWFRLSTVQWDYDPANQPYNDSAVLLRWNEQELAPGQTRTVATYYGVGDVTTQAGVLTLHLTALRNLRAQTGQLTPNPFDVNLLVFNNSGAAVNAVEATLHLPVSLALVSGEFATKLVAPSNLGASQNGTASWKVVAQCPAADIDLTMTVEVKAAGNLNNTVGRAIFLPSCAATVPRFEIVAQPKLQSVAIGGNARFKIYLMPLFGFNQTARLSVFPFTPGVSAALLPNTIAPADTAFLDLLVDRNVLPGDYQFIVSGTSGVLASSDSVTLRVVTADLRPPFLANFNPARDARDVPLQAAIAVDVLDDLAGVDSASIRIVVLGDTQGLVPVDTRLTAIVQGYRLHATPRLSLRDHETVRVSISASDLAAPPNVLPPLPYSFTTIKDTLAPYVLELQPGRNAANVPRETAIAARLRDDLAGVDSASIRLLLNGNAMPAQVQREGLDFVVRFQPQQPFAFNDTVRVHIIAADLSTARNRDTTAAVFFVVEDRKPPVITAINPLPFAMGVPPQTEILVEMRDEPAGVAPGSIRLAVNGQLQLPTVTGTPQLYRLQLPLQSVITPIDGDTVRVSLAARDMSNPPRSDSLSYYFVLGREKTPRDSLPPFVANRNPAAGAVGVPAEAEISVTVVDLESGVDVQALVMEIDGQRVPAQTLGDRHSATLNYKPAAPWPYNAVVRVRVQAQDLAAAPNLMPPDTFAFAIREDRAPPIVTSFFPMNNATQVPANATISFNLQDSVAGVDRATISLRVNGELSVPEITGGPQFFALRYKPAQDFRPNQAVEVRIRARDQSTPPNEMPENVFRFTTSPPLPDLIALDLQAAENFTLGRSTKVIGKLQANGTEVIPRFRIAFYGDGQWRSDTTITAPAGGNEIGIETRLRFDTPGTHIAEMVADAGNEVQESDENNNRRQLTIDLAEAQVSKLTVRPNPFTPNGDGYNDIVEFNFTGLNLDSPSLHIFDANGISVWSSPSQNGTVYAWNGRDQGNRELQPGVYLYTLRDHGRNVASGYLVIAR